MYFVKNTILPYTIDYKDLDLTLSVDLKMNTHINYICTNAYVIINRIFRYFNNNIYILKAIYILCKFVLFLNLIPLFRIPILYMLLIQISLKKSKNDLPKIIL